MTGEEEKARRQEKARTLIGLSLDSDEIGLPTSKEAAHRRAMRGLLKDAEAWGLSSEGQLALNELLRSPTSVGAAVAAIRAYIAAGLPVPVELHPWLSKALDGYEAQKGIKSRVRARNTQRRKKLGIHLIVSRMSEGRSQPEAIAEVASLLNWAAQHRQEPEYACTEAALEHMYSHNRDIVEEARAWVRANPEYSVKIPGLTGDGPTVTCKRKTEFKRGRPKTRKK